MPQDSHTNDDSSEADKKYDSTPHATVRAKAFGLRWIIIGGCIVAVALLFISIFLPNLTERVKFFTVNFLSLLVLTVIAVQAYIYRRQWEAMQGQLEAMKAQEEAMKGQLEVMQATLVETQKTVSHNERAVEVAKQSIEIAEKSSIYANRAYVTASVSTVKRFMFHLSIENSGNTPANNVSIAYYCDLREEEPDGNDVSGEHKVTIGHIAPKGRHLHDASYGGDQITAEQHELLQRESLKFYCWGWIYYEDIFNERRRSQFSFYHKPGSSVALPCERGNRAD